MDSDTIEVSEKRAVNEGNGPDTSSENNPNTEIASKQARTTQPKRKHLNVERIDNFSRPQLANNCAASDRRLRANVEPLGVAHLPLRQRAKCEATATSA